MIIDYWYKKTKNCFKGFERKWPKSLKNGQIRSVNEFLQNSIYFYQKLHIKIKSSI